MSRVKNFINEKTTRKIVGALCALDLNTIHKLAKDSDVPVNRLHNIIAGAEKITQIEKEKLIVYLVKLVDMGEMEEQTLTSLKDPQYRNTG